MPAPPQGQIRPVDPLVLEELGTLIDGEINRAGDYAGDKVFMPKRLGEGVFTEIGGVSMGNTFTLQRIAANQFGRRPQDGRRAPNGDIRMGSGLSLDPLIGRTLEYSWGEPMASQNAKRAQGIALEAALVALNFDKARIEREFRLDDFLSGTWHADSGALATPWTDEVNSDPISDLQDACRKTRANTIFFCEEAWDAFISHDKVLTARPHTVDRNILSEAEALADILNPKLNIQRIVISRAKYYNVSAGEQQYICGNSSPYVWVGRDSTDWFEMGSREFRVGFCAGKLIYEDVPAGPGYVMPTRMNDMLLEKSYVSTRRSWDLTLGHAETLVQVNASAGLRLSGITS